MKLLKVENNLGYFRTESGTYEPIDRISKDELLRLVNDTLNEDEVEFDEYDEK